jgi:class 3 adenylate cyclase
MGESEPIDTAHIKLPEDLRALKEQVAVNLRARLEREHANRPELASRLAEEALRVLVGLGFRVQPGTVTEGPTCELLQPDSILSAIADPGATISSLTAIWRTRTTQPGGWLSSPSPSRALGQRLLKLGAPVLALDVVAKSLETWPEDVEMRQLQGLALARTGLMDSANEILNRLYLEGERDEQTVGLLARTHKDMAFSPLPPHERMAHLQHAYDLYSEAFEKHPSSYWTGINACSMATLLGKREVARSLAARIAQQCSNRLDGGGSSEDPFWLLATLGEAALNLQDWDRAREWYKKACQKGGNRFGDLNAARRQARLLLSHFEEPHDLVDLQLTLPRVVVCSGHMIDAPTRPAPRFPQQLEGAVRDAVRERVRSVDGFIGFASAANGTDLLFLETLLELQGEVHVVLPFEPEAFCRDSVDLVTGSGWRERFFSVLDRATQVIALSRERISTGALSYDYANQVLYGLASLRARELDTELVGLAVWDGRKGDGIGGTSTAVRRWKDDNIRCETVDTDALLKSSGISGSLPSKPDVAPPPPRIRPRIPSRVMSMIFADAVHFSKLTEDQVPRFVEHFLGGVAHLLEVHSSHATFKNTWGDGLYVVFSTVREAGLFALDLADFSRTTDWAAKGLPPTLNARVAVHAGPVYRCMDPVIKKINWTGTHTSRTARIEPITPPGHVYASQAFAALVATEGVTDFECEYVKQAELAKSYGSFPTYVLRRPRNRAS